MFKQTMTWLVILTSLLISVQAESQVSDPNLFPGEQFGDRMLEQQVRADRFYAQGKYQRAYDIYFRDFAWRGDKYSQYMVGMMHWLGQGRPKDPVKAAAWLRLSAQRGNLKMVETRDQLWSQLDEAQRRNATVEFEQLREEYGDRKVIRRLVRKDQDLLRRSMTRFFTLRNSNMDIVFDDQGTRTKGMSFYEEVHDRIEQRVGYLKGYVELGELVLIDDDASEDNTPEETKTD